MDLNAGSLFESYKHFVTKNPLLSNEIEVGLKWMSYIVAGRIAQSPVVTEFIHSASKLLNLVNDCILKRAAGIPINDEIAVEKLQIFLTVIEHAEVFIEVAAHRIGSPKSKWLIVILVELIKFTIRLVLLLKHSQGLQLSPPICPLNRQKDIPQLFPQEKNSSHNSASSPSNVEVTFTLKSSKRLMRTLESAPPLVSRSWKLPKLSENSSSLSYKTPSKLEGKYFAAELLHICRPLAHLTSMAVCGQFSWKPFLLALGLDAMSLHLLREKSGFNKMERVELNRRTFSLLVYMLRSPFYDQYSKKRIIHILKSIAENFFGSGLILRPLIEYLPEWQQIYFYAWSS